jgi:hypothetical protein
VQWDLFLDGVYDMKYEFGLLRAYDPGRCRCLCGTYALKNTYVIGQRIRVCDRSWLDVSPFILVLMLHFYDWSICETNNRWHICHYAHGFDLTTMAYAVA